MKKRKKTKQRKQNKEKKTKKTLQKHLPKNPASKLTTYVKKNVKKLFEIIKKKSHQPATTNAIFIFVI